MSSPLGTDILSIRSALVRGSQGVSGRQTRGKAKCVVGLEFGGSGGMVKWKKEYVPVAKRSAYIKKGAPKGTRQVVETALRLQKKDGFSQNAAAAAVGMSSSGLKKAQNRLTIQKKLKKPPIEKRGKWCKLTRLQKFKLLCKFFLLQSQGRQPTAPWLWRTCNLVNSCKVGAVRSVLKQADQAWRRRKTKSAMVEGDAEERVEWAKEMLQKLRTDPAYFWKTDCWTDCFSVSMPMCEAPLRTKVAWLPKGGDEVYAPWATGPGDHRYKGWCVHFFYGIGPIPATKNTDSVRVGRERKKGGLLFLERYRGGGKEHGGWCKQLAVHLIRKGFLDKAKRKNPRKRFCVQADRDGAFTSAHYHRELGKLGCSVWNTVSRASDVAPIEKPIGFAKRIIEFRANSTPKWRNGVKDTPKNREAWAKFCEGCVKEITKRCPNYYTDLIQSMHTVPAKLIAAKGNRIRG
jgi:hypothetical protein